MPTTERTEKLNAIEHPSELCQVAHAEIEALNADLIFAETAKNLPPEAAAHYLTSVNLLGAALQAMKLAHYCSMQGR